MAFTPDPPRAALLAVVYQSPATFDAAVADSRKLLPSDTQPRGAGPEGNAELVVERFTSSVLGTVLGLNSGNFSVVYIRDAKGAITSMILAPGDDIQSIVADARR